MAVFKRGKSWYVDYRVNGKRLKRSFGRHKAMAELFLKDIDLKRVRGELRMIEDKISLESFFEKYLEYCKYNKSRNTFRVDKSKLAIFKGFLREKEVNSLTEITPGLVEQFKSFVLQRGKPVTYNHYLELIKAILNKAVEWNHLSSNSIASCKRLKDRYAKQVRFLSKEEISVILQNASPTMQQIIKLYLYTGLRKSELVYLHWDDIDFINKLITVQAKPEQGFHPKSYKPRSIPMNPEVEKILLDLPQKGRFVFDNGKNEPLHHDGYYYRELKRIYNRCGIRNASLHTLRHTFASHLVMGGADIRSVQELLGHSEIRVTERYSHLSPKHLSSIVNSLDLGTKGEQNQGSPLSPRCPPTTYPPEQTEGGRDRTFGLLLKRQMLYH